jgi:hypothetical protein
MFAEAGNLSREQFGKEFSISFTEPGKQPVKTWMLWMAISIRTRLSNSMSRPGWRSSQV